MGLFPQSRETWGDRRQSCFFSPTIANHASNLCYCWGQGSEAQLRGRKAEDEGYGFAKDPETTTERCSPLLPGGCEAVKDGLASWPGPMHFPPSFPWALNFSSLLPTPPLRFLPALCLLTGRSESDFAFKAVLKVQIFFFFVPLVLQLILLYHRGFCSNWDSLVLCPVYPHLY